MFCELIVYIKIKNAMLNYNMFIIKHKYYHVFLLILLVSRVPVEFDPFLHKGPRGVYIWWCCTSGTYNSHSSKCADVNAKNNDMKYGWLSDSVYLDKSIVIWWSASVPKTVADEVPSLILSPSESVLSFLKHHLAHKTYSGSRFDD